jgi:lantibiotic transport system ATP-binding protein
MSEAYVVTTERLSKFFGPVRAVDDLNLQVPAGTIYGFLGPNGAGKTTTIRLLLGLVRPSRGEVSIFGLNLASHRKACLGKIGALVEAPSLYPHLTGRENLQVVQHLGKIPANRIDLVLRQMELGDVAGRRVAQYSQGMKQRLGLAMALLNEPRLLILDEPTNGLDPSGIREVRELLRRLAAESGTTVFLSSHLLAEIDLVATHLGIINEGRLLFQGTLEDLHRKRIGHTKLRTSNPEQALALLKTQAANCWLGRDGLVHLDSSDSEDAARMNQLLLHAGLRVYSIESQGEGLEELFMQLTRNAA